MNIWELPTTVEIDGKEYPIRSDYRAIIDIFGYIGNPDYFTDEQTEIALRIFYPDYEKITSIPEAIQRMKSFIDLDDAPKKSPQLMSWEQDSPLIISAVNRVMGKEVRAEKYLHWWTFRAAYMEISDGVFASIVRIRQKRANGEKLTAEEKKYYLANRNMIEIKKRKSAFEMQEEAEEEAELNRILGL